MFVTNRSMLGKQLGYGLGQSLLKVILGHKLAATSHFKKKNLVHGKGLFYIIEGLNLPSLKWECQQHRTEEH